MSFELANTSRNHQDPSLVGSNALQVQPHCRKVASIIIACYNGSNYLNRCLSTVLADVGDTCEIVVVDNNSTDGSPQLIRENYPSVRLIENERNIGFAAACNQGAAQARSETLVFLNQDTYVCEGWLSGLIEPLNIDSTIGLVTSMLLIMSYPTKINSCGQNVHYSGLTFLRGFMQDQSSNALREFATVDAVNGASFAIRRSLWQELGGFDEQLFMYYEETDLSWRAMLLGARSVYTPHSVVYHDYSPAQPSFSSLIYSKRNRYVLLVKNWGASALILLLPGIILAELADWGHTLLVGRSAVNSKLAAYRSIIRMWPQIASARRVVQASRLVDDSIVLKSFDAVLAPAEFAGGRWGKVLTSALNILMSANRAAAIWIFDLFGRSPKS